MSGPVENQEEHPEAGDPRPETGRVPGTPQGFPVPLAYAIGEWAARQDARHLLPGWLAEVGRGAPEGTGQRRHAASSPPSEGQARAARRPRATARPRALARVRLTLPASRAGQVIRRAPRHAPGRRAHALSAM